MCVVQPVVEAQKQTEEYGGTEQQTRVLDQGACATDCKLTLTALHHMGANDGLLRPHDFASFTSQIMSGEEGEAGLQIIFYFLFFKFCKLIRAGRC